MEDLENRIEKNGGLNPSEMQYLGIVAQTKKDLLKADEIESKHDDASYRRAYRDGTYRETQPLYEDRYDRRRRDRLGRYTDDGYSRGDSGLIDELRGMMGDLPANKQRELQQLIKRYER